MATISSHGDASIGELVAEALENAVSVASVLFLTEATLTEVEEPKANGQALHEEAFTA